MIIWINGAFGSGKTQVSYELHKRIPNSYVYDSETVGFFIRKNVPKEIQKEDFQDYSIWRELNYTTLKYVESEFKGIIIVPMTIVNPSYFEEIVCKLRNEGVIVNHVVLSASKDILKKRLRKRGNGKNSWAAKQIDRCMQGLSNEIFEGKINTDNMTIESVVEEVARRSGIALLPDKRSRVRKGIDRIIVMLKHM